MEDCSTHVKLPAASVIDCYMNASLGLGAPTSMKRHSADFGLLRKLAPRLNRWHVETQDRLFGHLRKVWADDRPRVMVDLG
jgi:hypothetical protein